MLPIWAISEKKKQKKRAQAGYHVQEGKKITSLLAG